MERQLEERADAIEQKVTEAEQRLTAIETKLETLETTLLSEFQTLAPARVFEHYSYFRIRGAMIDAHKIRAYRDCAGSA